MDRSQKPTSAPVASRHPRRPPLESVPSSLASSSRHSSNSEEDVNTSSTSTNALLRRGLLSGDGAEGDLATMLSHLPSSRKDLFARLERQRDEMRLLQEENVQLKSREVEVSSLTLKLQQQFAATQSQVDGIKAQIQLQLANQVTEEEYNRIDRLPESQRDLLDTIKLGIYRQLGSMRASMQAATRRSSELAATTSQLDAENRDLKLELSECKMTLEREREAAQGKTKASDKQTAHVLELESTVKDLQTKLRSSFQDQEQFLSAKLHAQMKTDEAARLALKLEESEMDAQRYKANAECNEQKLDILKSEYYELKLTYTQRILELESCLKAADEKIKTLGDLELESELFISTLAQRDRDCMDGGALVPAEPKGTSSALTYESYMALPRSRKLAHSVVVTKRCLHLENSVASLQQDVAYKDKQITRLQVSLEAARDALKNVNSPYAMVEKTVDELYSENEQQKDKLRLLQEENKDLREKLEERTADVQVLCKHRKELLRMRSLLKKLGVSEGYDLDDVTPKGASDAGESSREAARAGLRSSLRAQESCLSSRGSDAQRAARSSDVGAPSSSLRQRNDLESARNMPGIEISS